jgi:prevent-host-death family protein
MCTLTEVDHVGIRDLRGDLAAAVRRAGGGERLVVTVAGRPVAQLGPLDPGAAGPTIEDLAARGLLEPAVRSDRPEPSSRIPLWAGSRLDRVLDEVR